MTGETIAVNPILRSASTSIPANSHLRSLVVGRGQLARADFERAEAAGSAMDVDTAIAEALATPPPASVPAMMFGASTAVER